MEYIKYQDNYVSDIINLKNDLMEDENGSITSENSDVSSLIEQNINIYIDNIFEDNIRGILVNFLNFQKVDIPQDIFYKQLEINKSTVVKVLQNEEKTENIKDNSYKISFGKDFTFSMENLVNKSKVEIKSDESNVEKTFEIDGNKFVLSKYKQVEMDGFFKIKNFKIDSFDPNEVETIFANVNNQELTKCECAIMEAKLNPKKIEELVEQIKKDYKLLKDMKEKKIFLGFINSTKVSSFKKGTFKDINCVIFGIKNSVLFGKNVSRSIDWNLEQKFNEFVKEIKGAIEKQNELIKKQSKSIRILRKYIKEKNEKKAKTSKVASKKIKTKVPMKKP